MLVYGRNTHFLGLFGKWGLSSFSKWLTRFSRWPPMSEWTYVEHPIWSPKRIMAFIKFLAKNKRTIRFLKPDSPNRVWVSFNYKSLCMYLYSTIGIDLFIYVFACKVCVPHTNVPHHLTVGRVCLREEHYHEEPQRTEYHPIDPTHLLAFYLPFMPFYISSLPYVLSVSSLHGRIL